VSPLDALRHPPQTCFARAQSTSGQAHGARFVLADRLVCACAPVVGLAFDRRIDEQPQPSGRVPAHLAADAVGAPGLPADERARLICPLVSVAAAIRTKLYMVLARLIRADSPVETAALAGLRALAQRAPDARPLKRLGDD
jgi:hypothetical protein